MAKDRLWMVRFHGTHSCYCYTITLCPQLICDAHAAVLRHGVLLHVFNRFNDPCERKYCAYDAHCEVENDKAICKCKTECPNAEEPICGTDGVTYRNLCNLRATACQNKLNIRVQHPSECRENVY
ncbi:hypothetical protein PGB90_003607 [Kerria lacca]